MKRPITVLSATLLAGCIAMTGITPAMASGSARNNNTNRYFTFTTPADGSESAIKPQRKEDSSKAYVKNKASGSSIDVDVFVCGTSNVNKYPAFDPNRCSTRYTVATGTYQYMANTVYGNYTYAYLTFGSHLNKVSTVSGWWSPDNVRGL